MKEKFSQHILTVWSEASLLMFSILGKNFSRRHFEIFFLFFFQKIGFDISCKLSPDNLHERSMLIFWEKYGKKKSLICYILKMVKVHIFYSIPRFWKTIEDPDWAMQMCRMIWAFVVCICICDKNPFPTTCLKHIQIQVTIYIYNKHHK